MDSTLRLVRRWRSLTVLTALAAALALAACGDDDSGGGGSGGSADSGKKVRIAYLSFAVANSYDAPMLAAAEDVAKKSNAEITVFDAKNDPKRQFAQLQNAAGSGRFDGIIVQPIFGPGLIPGVQDAIGRGIAVVNMDQILGEDLTTSEPQVEGLAGNVVFVPTDIGTKLGKLTIQACEEKKLDPCNVGYLFSIKVSALDTAIRKAYDEAIAGTPVEVVAEGESFFTPAKALAATQNMLQAEPDLGVIVGADQGIQGAEQALGDKEVILIGYGGSEAALKGVASGKWYGDVAQLPATEGRLAAEALIKAVREGTKSGGIDPVADLPNEGVVTKDNVSQFKGEWPG